MDAFNALWDSAEQRKRPPDNNFQLFTTEEWLALSSTHKILCGSLQNPLPPELEPRREEKKQAKTLSKQCDALARNQTQKSKPDQNTKQSDLNEKVYVPGLVKFPETTRLSSLSVQEHRDCLRLVQKFDQKDLGDLSATEKLEYQLFQALYMRVKNEQKEFIGLARQSWPEYVSRATNLRGDPRNFVLQLWKDKVHRSLAMYPKNYKRLKLVSLDHKTMLIKMLLIRNLLKIGRVPILKLPEFDRPFRISTSPMKLKAWRLLNIPETQLTGSLHKIPVSRDPNAERLARLNSANVVISSSGIKCLLDNYGKEKLANLKEVGRSWILPITVKEYRTFECGKPVIKTTVFIDKELPPAKMTGFQKVNWYQKHALSAAVVHPYHHGGIEFEIEGAEFFIRRDPEEQISSTLHSEVIEAPSAPLMISKEQNESVNIDVNSDTSVKETEYEESALSQVNVSLMIPKEQKESGKIFKISDSSAKEAENEELSLSKVNGSLDVPSDAVPSILDDDQTQDGDSSDDDALLIALPDEDKNLVSPQARNVTQLNIESGSHIDATKSLELKQAENSLPLNDRELTEGDLSVKEGTSYAIPPRKSDYSGPCSGPSDMPTDPPTPSVKMVNGVALPLKTTNVTYNLWSLLPETVENDSRPKAMECNSSMNLLIRSRIDGCLSESGTYHHLCLATKPEFQLEFGAGAIPLSALTRQWAKLLIQPDSSLARVRVNVHSSEMVKVEKRSKADVEHEAEVLHQVDLNKSLSTLYGVLSDLVTLPCGNYVLSHSPEMGLAAQLFINTKDPLQTDWNLSYGVTPEDIACEVPWQPIDATVLMPKNFYFQTMPCTFQAWNEPKAMPKRFQSSKPQEKEVVSVNTYKKKKKKKGQSKEGQSKEESS